MGLKEDSKHTCSFLQKQVSEVGGLISVSRGCDYSSCVEKDESHKVLGVKVRDIRKCCTTSQCNSASSIKMSVVMATAMILAVISRMI